MSIIGGGDGVTRRYYKARRAYFIIYLLLFLALLAYIFFSESTGILRGDNTRKMLNFSRDWVADGASVINFDDFVAYEFGGSVNLEKTLPDTVYEDDMLCLATSNLRFRVYVDGMELYSFKGTENITGKGYGVAYHSIRLSPENAGKTVRIDCATEFDNNKGGRIFLCRIGSDGTFVEHMSIWVLMSLVSSVGTFFIGVLVFLLCLFIPKKKRTRFLLLSISAVAICFGLWSTNDIGILRLLTGKIVACRILDNGMLHLGLFSFALFISSITYEQKLCYLRLAFLLMLADIGIHIFMRYAFNIDMAWLSPVLAAYYVLSIAVMAAMIISDKRFRKEHKIFIDFRLFNIGMTIMAVSVFIDAACYFIGIYNVAGRGIFTRLGFALFIALMIIQCIRWWGADRNAAKRDRFINRALQYAVSESDPETSIYSMLSYLGTELHARRTYIFENQNNGFFTSTYEWFADGMEPRKAELCSIPYKGFIDELYNVYLRNGKLIVSSREQCRDSYPMLHNVLEQNGVERFVVGPLEENGALIGFFGVDNAPIENLQEISEIIRVIAYIFAQLILHREGRQKLVHFSYYDSLTDCHNRHAFSEFLTEPSHFEEPYGFLMCDINGLKQTNDSLGHEAGDELILDVAAALKEIFCADNVYRMGGDEFVAYAQRADSSAFAADVALLREAIVKKGRSAAIGAVFCTDGNTNYKEILSKADREMYEDKRRYYEGLNDRRGQNTQ